MPRYDPVDAIHQGQLRFDRAYRFLAGDTKAVERRYKPHILAMLRAAGFQDLEIGCCGANDSVDLVIRGQRVELKIARNRRKRASSNEHFRDHYYQALLRDHKNGHYLNGDFVLLVCVDEAAGEMCPFVIPTWAVGDRRTIEITSDPFAYRGRWAHYRGRFDLLRQEGSDGHTDSRLQQ